MTERLPEKPEDGPVITRRRLGKTKILEAADLLAERAKQQNQEQERRCGFKSRRSRFGPDLD